MPQRRRLSRSLSPLTSKHKRSWQPSASSFGQGRSNRRSNSPRRSNFKRFKSPKFGGGRSFGGGRRSRSPRSNKRQRPKSPASDDNFPAYKSQSHLRFLPSPEWNRPPPRSGDAARDNRTGGAPMDDRSGSRLRQRSPSPQPPPNTGQIRGRHFGRSSRSPDMKRDRLQSGPSKNKGFSPPPIKRQRSNSPRGQSPRRQSTSHPDSSRKRDEVSHPSSSSHKQRSGSIPQRRVSTTEKKKLPRMTLHERFTTENQERVHVEDNVTIAILRNPNAEPSEETTVKRVFDSSLFKMVHKVSEGRRPIFDREEIKVWRHDDNTSDDPDFERRLVRVKSSNKSVSEGISRMSPDVIRKAFGKQLGNRSRSGSPRREPEIRLDPRPDPKYESRYRQQMKREKESIGRRLDHRKDSPEDDHRGVKKRQADDGLSRRNQTDSYDLRQALERRRSDREDGGGGFRIEISRGEREPSTELFYRDSDTQRQSSMERGRNVVMGRGRRDSGDDSFIRDDRRRGRGRGFRGGFNKNFNKSPDRRGDRGGSRERREERRSLDRRQIRYSASPSRGGRRGGFRPRGRGRGRDRDYGVFEEEDELATPSQMNALSDAYKYLEHDDRDISPKQFRGRGGRGRFQSRGFGSREFRGTGRGFRGRGKFKGASGFRGKPFGGGRGGGSDRRSGERGRPLSVEREWKHDMYDSLQAEEEEPHSTTMGTL